jgi:hypothetical protein
MRSFKTTTIPGTIAVENESQLVADRDPRRDMLMILNPDTETGHLYFNIGDDAASDGTSLSLPAGQHIKFDQPGAVPTGCIHVTAADPGHRFVLLVGQRGNVE